MDERIVLDSMSRSILLVLQREGGWVLLQSVRFLIAQELPTSIYEKVLKNLMEEGYVYKRSHHFYKITQAGLNKASAYFQVRRAV